MLGKRTSDRLEIGAGLLAMLSFVALLALRQVWELDVSVRLCGAGVSLVIFGSVILHAQTRQR
jgi:hypothetical protein